MTATRRKRSLKRALGLSGIALIGAAGLVSAQPSPAARAPAPPAPPVAAPPPLEVPPTGPAMEIPATEEAPPAEVAIPAPISAPPVQAKEVAPAPPPKAQVAEKPTEAAIKRSRSNVAILQALDKVTAESIRFEAEVGKPVRYKSLIFTVKACERAAPDEPMDDSIVYLTVDSQPRPAPGKPIPPPRQAFKGWMYASSPGLNPLEHPVYDAWVISCRAPAPVVTAAAPPAPPPVKPKPKPRAPVAPNPPVPAADATAPAPTPNT